MARMKVGKLTRDVRINVEGKPDMAGRLYLRGTEVTVHPDFADELLEAAKSPRRRARRTAANKQAEPPVSK